MMIKLLLKDNNYYKIFIIIIFSLYGESTFASNLYFTVKGTNIEKSNVIVSGDTITPNFWFPQPNLLPVTSWAPIFQQDKRLTISLQDINNPKNSFKQNISLKGMAYQFDNFTVSNNSDFSMMNKCADVEASNSHVITVGGSRGTIKCVSSKQLNIPSSSNETVPFRYFKPIVNLPNLLENLQNAGEGRYTGVYSSEITYAFKLSNGVISYRTLPYAISFEIKYEPAEIIDVQVIGDGKIAPIYNKDKRTISGKSEYLINIKGNFPSGVKLTFKPNSADNHFYLKNDFSGLKIPYFINCQICTDRVISNDKGEMSNPKGIYYIDKYRNDFGFKLMIGYNGIKADDLENGGYHDTFYAFFEPVL
ncbi:TPA: hypothetical protein ACX6QK_000235 [Photobacterium damselae]